MVEGQRSRSGPRGSLRGDDAGGLIAYGTGLLDTFPRIPVYVDKILKGAKPGDLPIEVMTQHVLVISLKTARRFCATSASAAARAPPQLPFGHAARPEFRP